MAKKPPPEHTRWKPGQSGNIAGKKKDLLTQSKVKGIISQQSDMSISKLKDIVEDPKSSALEVAVAAQLIKSTAGDTAAFNFSLERSIGKVKETKEIILPKPTVIERLDGRATILGADMPAQIEGEIIGEYEE